MKPTRNTKSRWLQITASIPAGSRLKVALEWVDKVAAMGPLRDHFVAIWCSPEAQHFRVRLEYLGQSAV